MSLQIFQYSVCLLCSEVLLLYIKIITLQKCIRYFIFISYTLIISYFLLLCRILILYLILCLKSINLFNLLISHIFFLILVFVNQKRWPFFNWSPFSTSILWHIHMMRLRYTHSLLTFLLEDDRAFVLFLSFYYNTSNNDFKLLIS